MSPGRIARKLAAILAADVVGFSRLVAADESATVRQWKAHQAALQPIISEHHGRLFNTQGDGFLVEFASAVDAVECAVAIQRHMVAENAHRPSERRIQLRVGVHVGDVVADEDDLLGDGVNIAARLQATSDPDGVVVSARVVDDVRGKVALSFRDLGEHQLKNIPGAVRLYAVEPTERREGSPAATTSSEKPSIAVLPFNNMSPDPEQEYFADGIVEDITTALSNMRWLFVVARNSAFTYKGRSVDVKQVGRELGVRYVLEGSVRKAGDRLRITGQLIEASTGAHLWAKRFDGQLADVFDLQDQITEATVAAIEPTLRYAEVERIKRKPPESLEAYDLYLRALPHYHKQNEEGLRTALVHLRRALDLDPEYPIANALTAIAMARRLLTGWDAWDADVAAEAVRRAHAAVEASQNDPAILASGAYTVAACGREYEKALSWTERAVLLNPNSAELLGTSGWAEIVAGKPELAAERFKRALRVNPLDPAHSYLMAGLTAACYLSHDYMEAVEWGQKAIIESPGFATAHRWLAGSLMKTGREAEARSVIERLLKHVQPNCSISQMRPFMKMFAGHDEVEDYLRTLEAAGLPAE